MVQAKIVGCGKYVPERIVSNSFFVEQNPLFQYSGKGERVSTGIETSEDWIVRRTGIAERRWTEKLQVHDMAAVAINQALERSPFSVKDLDGIVIASVTQEGYYPSAACKVRELLQARANDCYDILAACAGFPVAVDKVSASIKARKSGVYAVVGVEKLSAHIDHNDVNAPLFGDGAGAWILADGNSAGIIATYSHINTSKGRTGWIKPDSKEILRMPNGREVFKDAKVELVKACKKLTEDAGWNLKDVDLILFHQANKRILDTVQEDLGLCRDQMFTNIQMYGNTSAASAPICYAEAWEQKKIHPGDKILMACIGAGMITSGVAAIV